MYGFIYSQYNDIRGVFYDGNPENLKYCRDQKEAKKRWEDYEHFMIEHTVKLYAGKYLKIKLPVKDGTPSDAFADFVMGQKIDPVVQRIIGMVLDEFECNEDGTFQRRLHTGDKEVSGVLMHMRDIIEGVFRISPLKIQTGTKQSKNRDTIDYPLGQNVFTPVKYTVGGKEYKTPLFGIYSSSVRKLMFPMSDFDGNTLQRWQRDAFYKRGQFTYIVAARESGKSISSTSFAGVYLLRELCFPSTDPLRGVLIHYYGQSGAGNKQPYIYVKTMLQKVMQGADFVKYDDTKQIISFTDNGLKRELQFISSLAESKGRGERPSMVIVDESARMPAEIYDIAIGTAGIPIIFISTVNYETRRNWFYDGLVDAEKEQRKYEPIDELIHRLWTSYGLHLVKSEKDVQWHIDNRTFEKIREEFYLARPTVGLRYTIDDIEDSILSPAAKLQKIKNASKRGEKFLMAEYYGYYIDEEDVFSPEGLTVPDIPKQFDYIAIGFDTAKDHDNAAAVAIGLCDDIAYVIESKKLSKDPAIQCREIKDMQKQMSFLLKSGSYVYLGVDLTGNGYTQALLEDRDIRIDYPIKYTPSKTSDVRYKGREHLIGKEYLVRITKEQYFWKNAIRIREKLNSEGGLLDEISDFKHKTNGKYEAATGKDDQVNAMMMALYVLYDLYMKDVFVKSDAPATQRIGSLKEMIESHQRPAEEEFTKMVTFWN